VDRQSISLTRELCMYPTAPFPVRTCHHGSPWTLVKKTSPSKTLVMTWNACRDRSARW
jgi:hypothetical protein